MPSLYDLSNQYRQMEQYANDILDTEDGNEEEILQMLVDTLDAIDDSIEVKLENTVKFIKSIESDQLAYKAEKDRLAKKEKSSKNTVERLKKYMQESLELSGKSKVDAGLFKVRLQANPPSVRIINEALIPDEFKIPQPSTIDTKEILKRLKADKVVDGVELVKDKQHIRYS